MINPIKNAGDIEGSKMYFIRFQQSRLGFNSIIATGTRLAQPVFFLLLKGVSLQVATLLKTLS
jgi:hypothetical protein